MNHKTFTRLSIFVGLAAALGLTLNSCGQSGDMKSVVEERDSLRNVSKSQEIRLARLDTLITVINSSMDTIAASEAGLFVNGVSEGVNKRDQILGNIDRLSALISHQRSQIETLEKQLAESKEENSAEKSNMAGLIANFKKQLQEKDQQIASLKQELSQKDADISKLTQRVGLQSRTIAELDRRNAAQNEALKRQDALLNNCYMAIGTKKSLESKGIIKKGKMVAQSSLDRSAFKKVDIRTFTEIQFTAKRPRILTPMPEGAYTLTTDGNKNYTLQITNPGAFWKVSNYLIIQTD